jgi:hypothetical protein
MGNEVERERSNVVVVVEQEPGALSSVTYHSLTRAQYPFALAAKLACLSSLQLAFLHLPLLWACVAAPSPHLLFHLHLLPQPLCFPPPLT